MNRRTIWLMIITASVTLFGCKGVETTYTPIDHSNQEKESVFFNNNIDKIDDQPLDKEEEEYFEEKISEKDIDDLEKSKELDGACFQSGNLVENHSFECSDLAHNSWNVFDRIPGWQADNSYNDAGLELQCGAVGSLSGSDGPCHIELDAHAQSGFSNSDVRIFQDIPVEEGLCYELSYDYSPRTSNQPESNHLVALWNDEKIASHTSTVVGWEHFSHYIDSSKAGARLAFAANIDDDTLGAQLDNVSVTEISCKEEEESDQEQNESVGTDEDLDSEPELICEDTSLAFIWGDIEGNTRKWNNFGYSYVRILNQHGKIAAQDLIKWDRHDVFYGNEDAKKIGFYTRVITHYDGFSISAKHCYPEGEREDPEFEIVLGDVFKKKIVLKRDKYFSYKKIRGDDVKQGHGLVVLGVKKHASEVHFVAGNWRPKEFHNKRFQNYKGVFNGHVFGHADDDGRLNGKWGAKDADKQIFHGKVRMQDKSMYKVRGKYKQHKNKKHFGLAGGRVYQKNSVEDQRKIRLRYFNMNGDKHGTLFGWMLAKNSKEQVNIDTKPNDVDEDIHGIE